MSMWRRNNGFKFIVSGKNTHNVLSANVYHSQNARNIWKKNERERMHKHFKCLLKKECINNKSRKRCALLVKILRFVQCVYVLARVFFFPSQTPAVAFFLDFVSFFYANQMLKYVNGCEALNIKLTCMEQNEKVERERKRLSAPLLKTWLQQRDVHNLWAAEIKNQQPNCLYIFWWKVNFYFEKTNLIQCSLFHVFFSSLFHLHHNMIWWVIAMFAKILRLWSSKIYMHNSTKLITYAIVQKPFGPI